MSGKKTVDAVGLLDPKGNLFQATSANEAGLYEIAAHILDIPESFIRKSFKEAGWRVVPVKITEA